MRGASLAGRLRAAGARCCTAALALSAQGCVSYSYVDAHQVQHVVGFVDVALPAAPSSGKAGATAVSLRTFGLSFFRHPAAGSDIALGYSEQSIVSLPDNGCIDLQAKSLCADRASHSGASTQ
ncbi:MAG: hypothetical protein WDN01_22235 [Rhizomicrobium sp.]